MTTGGIYLSRRLEQLLPGVVSIPFPRLKFYGGSIVPVFPDLAPGAPEVVREALSYVGDADLMGDGAVDIPVVNLSSTENRYRTFMYASAFSYTMQEMRAFERAGNANTVTSRRQAVAMRAIAERVDRFAAFGSAAHGVAGFLNNGAVTADNLSTDLWALTPDALAEFFLDTAATISRDSSGAFSSLDVLVSHDVNALLETTRMTDGADSVKAYILRASSYIRSFQWLDYLHSANMVGGQAGKDRIVFDPFDAIQGDIDPEIAPDYAENSEMHVEPVQMAPPEYWQTANLRTIVPMFMCVTGSIINQPSSFRYVDIPDKP